MRITATDGYAVALIIFAVVGFSAFIDSIFHISNFLKSWWIR